MRKWLWGMNKLMYMRHLEQCLALSKYNNKNKRLAVAGWGCFRSWEVEIVQKTVQSLDVHSLLWRWNNPRMFSLSKFEGDGAKAWGDLGKVRNGELWVPGSNRKIIQRRESRFGAQWQSERPDRRLGRYTFNDFV